MSLRCPHGGFISQCRECYEDRVEVRTMRAVERIEDMLTKPYPEGDVMDALAAERKRIRAAVEGLPYVYRQHTCWDNHEGGVDANGNSTLHADGSPCNDRVTTDAINRASVLAAIDGEEVSR